MTKVKASQSVVLAVFCIVLALYLYNITGWLDEDDEGTALYATWRFAEGEIPYLELTTTKGPLFLLLGAGLIKLTGSSLFLLRSITAIALIGAGYIWFNGLRSMFSVPASLLGSLTFLLMPEVYRLGRLFRADSWMLVLIACALAVALIGEKSGRTRWWLLSGALLGLAMLFKVIAILPFWGCTLFLFLRVLFSRPRKSSLIALFGLVVSFFVIAGGCFCSLGIFAPEALAMIIGAQGTSTATHLGWAFVIARGIQIYGEFASSNLIIIPALPFFLSALPKRGRFNSAFLFICVLLTASAILVMRGAVFTRYLAYASLGFSGLYAVGYDHVMRSAVGRSRQLAALGLVSTVVILSGWQLAGWLSRTEDGTQHLASYIADNTTPDEVILTDFAEIAFHSGRRSIPQAGGIGFGWTSTGLITGAELIESIEDNNVSLVALHVPGGEAYPEHLFHLQDWDQFYGYIRSHFYLQAIIYRNDQLFEVYRRPDDSRTE